MIKFVDKIYPYNLQGDEVHVQIENGEVTIAKDDYFETGGICYMKIKLTRDDLTQILDRMSGEKS